MEERTALAKLPRLLAVAVGVLLLIGCANVANLSLVRAAARRPELATRLALGASRRSLFGRLLLEGTVLAAVGALLGVGIARLLVRSQSIVSTIAGMPERVGLDATLDPRVLTVALGVSAFTALVVSIAPVLDMMHVLRLLQSQFAGVSVVDARGAVVATVLVCVTTVVACYLPTRQASRLNPIDALRCD